MAPVSGRHSRSKGKREELLARDFWRPVFPGCERRACGEESQQDQGRDLKGTPGYAIQVKGMARPNPLAALAEASVAVHDGEIALAHCRRVESGHPSGEMPTVTLWANDARLLIACFERYRRAFPRCVQIIALALDGDPDAARELEREP
jgi:hypothetical protein